MMVLRKCRKRWQYATSGTEVISLFHLLQPFPREEELVARRLRAIGPNGWTDSQNSPHSRAMDDSANSLDGEQWMRLLEKVAISLGTEGPAVRLCLIGSAACLFGGMNGRTSRDLDVWRPASDYDRLELKTAIEDAGLLFDPKSILEPDRAYLQIVEPGLTQLGVFEPVLIDRIGRLQIFRPPVENLVAAKLIRADAKDLGDIRFLLQVHRPATEAIRTIIDTLPPPARERALENLVYLDILQS